MKRSRSVRPILGVALSILAVVFGGASALGGTCGPFTDFAADAFCPLMLEIFYLGITTGTTPTTYDPTSNVKRVQMAAFLSRTVDGVLKRGSRRAALDQFWTTQNGDKSSRETNSWGPSAFPSSDGADIWVSAGRPPWSTACARATGSCWRRGPEPAALLECSLRWGACS